MIYHFIKWKRTNLPIYSYLKNGEPVNAIRGGPATSRFIAEDTEDAHHHSLTIISIEPGDAGEYGVIVEGIYTPITRIKITGRE